MNDKFEHEEELDTAFEQASEIEKLCDEVISDAVINEAEEIIEQESSEEDEEEEILVPTMEEQIEQEKELAEAENELTKTGTFDANGGDKNTATKVAILPNTASMTKKKLAKNKKKSWFEPAGYTESVSTVHNIIKTLVYIVFITVIGCFLAYYVITRINDLYAFVKDTDEVEIVVPENATVNEIADILYNAGIIEYPSFFKFYAELKNASERYNFKAGTYVVNPMMNYDQLFLWLEGKAEQSIKRITIPEGYTVDEIINLFVEEGFGTREGFINAIQNYEFDNEFIQYIDTSPESGRHYRLEGYLYPDTYDVYTDKSEAYYIYKLLDRFEEVYTDKFKARADELGMTMDEVITLASMLEKEASVHTDYEIVSSVFHNRLNNKATFPMLESDATVVYAIQIATGKRVNELTTEDLKIDSKYNTYLYKGLPPGPIANPGYEAIVSALYPENTNYYYFVSSIEGETFFASTLAAHNKNVEKVKQLDAEYKKEHGID